jgi:acyl-CoA dehydrogenase
MTEPMNAEHEALTEAATALFGDLCGPAAVAAAEVEGWAPALWAALAESGFDYISVPESSGGAGGTVADAVVLLTVAGRFAAPVPLVETTLLAGWALAAAGVEVSGLVSSAPAPPGLTLTRSGPAWTVTGRLPRVPWGARADRIVTVLDSPDGPMVLVVPPTRATIEAGHNLAGEPRDTVHFDAVALGPDEVRPAPAGVTPAAFELRGALGRAALIAGALARVSELTNRYTFERHQFGRALSRFQAVQLHLVRIAEEATLTGIAVRAAAATAVPDPALFEVAAAKSIAGEAASIAAMAAHQAHGAMGMTREYELGQLTRRLWSWRDEYGSEKYWSRRLGEQLIAGGADELWPAITG